MALAIIDGLRHPKKNGSQGGRRVCMEGDALDGCGILHHALCGRCVLPVVMDRIGWRWRWAHPLGDEPTKSLSQAELVAVGGLPIARNTVFLLDHLEATLSDDKSERFQDPQGAGNGPPTKPGLGRQPFVGGEEPAVEASREFAEGLEHAHGAGGQVSEQALCCGQRSLSRSDLGPQPVCLVESGSPRGEDLSGLSLRRSDKERLFEGPLFLAASVNGPAGPMDGSRAGRLSAWEKVGKKLADRRGVIGGDTGKRHQFGSRAEVDGRTKAPAAEAFAAVRS
ncbi:hypothetical protein GGR88_001312 [Sphingomonas jejuensis]|uniref:DNA (cytosine-5-)-methyltransferase n=1 Tax=Sphingomonas jejuensis TaxID=904715 RepID=A0ABX0XKI1_9SPHN|nr:hypothetical protein [Sphingomonas jejuensis]NJC33838.1 hypothetical protein [Sphingomonas jejuensis]